MPQFKKKPVVVEAVRFTGDNWAEMHAFTGHKTKDGHTTDVFAEAGTYTITGRDVPTFLAELWVQANEAWLPLAAGEWVIKDQYGFYPCKGDETAPDNYEEI